MGAPEKPNRKKRRAISGFRVFEEQDRYATGREICQIGDHSLPRRGSERILELAHGAKGKDGDQVVWSSPSRRHHWSSTDRVGAKAGQSLRQRHMSRGVVR